MRWSRVCSLPSTSDQAGGRPRVNPDFSDRAGIWASALRLLRAGKSRSAMICQGKLQPLRQSGSRDDLAGQAGRSSAVSICTSMLQMSNGDAPHQIAFPWALERISFITELTSNGRLFCNVCTDLNNPSNMFVVTPRRHSDRYCYNNPNFADRFALRSDRILRRPPVVRRLRQWRRPQTRSSGGSRFHCHSPERREEQ